MKNTQFQSLVDQAGSETIIRLLEPYLTPQRQQRIDTVIANRLTSIELAIESPADINNALACVRSSEALGISTVHIIAPESEEAHPRGITQGAIYWLDVVYHKTTEDFLASMSQKNIVLAGGILQAKTDVSEIPIDNPVCLVMGNEQRGLSKKMLQSCDIEYAIPMYGMSESLNLSVSAAVSLYSTTARKRQQLKTNGDLNPKEKEKLKALYYLNSVDPRLIDGLLSKLRK